MRSLEEIIHDNGGDSTPFLDTHNLTGRAIPEGVEPLWLPLESDDPMDSFASLAPLEDFDEISDEDWSFSQLLDCE